MNADHQQQKVIAKGVTEGILKAVGILALVGLVVGVIIAIAHMDFSSGTDASRGLPVTVLVVNETSDSLLLSWRDTGAVSGQHVIPPMKGSACEHFYVHGVVGKPYRAAFEIRNPRSGQRDSSGWFLVGGQGTSPAWSDTVQVGRRRGIFPIRDFNFLASNNCSAY